MSEVKIATRESYGNALVELGGEHENLVVLDADLAAATKTGMFKKAFPDRHIDCGIAEANMTGVAAGMVHMWICTVCEHLRHVCGRTFLRAGAQFHRISASECEDRCDTCRNFRRGRRRDHQCNEDIALMRAIPGMVVINPADDIEARAAVKAAYEYVGPVYLRFGRLAVPVINDGADYKFEIGKGVTLREGSDCSIIATGLCVSEALAAADTLAEQGIHAEVINIHTIKPLDEELVVKTAKKTGRVFTVEEHSIIGGLGAAVAETLGEKCPTKITRIGVNDVFGESGPAKELLHKYGLDAEGIANRILREMK